MIERIKQVITYANMSERAFAERIGVKQNTLNQQIKGERGISLDIVSKILISFENISAEWLMRGEGDMLKEEKADNVNLPNYNFSIFTIREIGDKTAFERSVAINMNQVRAIEDHATTCRIIMVDGKEYEILCGFSDFIKR